MDEALRDRISRYVAGEATTEDLDRLREAAESDPSMAVAIFEAAELERDLRRLPAARRMKARFALRRGGASGWIGLAAAAALVAAAVLVSRGERPAPPRPRTEPPVVRGVEPEPVADPRPEKAGQTVLQGTPDKAPEKAVAEDDLRRTVERFRQSVAEEERRRAEADLAKARTVPPEVRPRGSRGATIAVAAVLRSVEGNVARIAAGRREAVKSSDVLEEGQGLAVAREGRAILEFEDGTRVELGGETDVTEIRAAGGKGLRVERGTITADVAKQAADQPMILATARGEARVLGTMLRLVVGASSTRLEVREGKVRLTEPGGTSVDVLEGHYAVAAARVPLLVKPLAFRIPFREDFERASPAGSEETTGVLVAGPPREGGGRCKESRPYNGGNPTIEVVPRDLKLGPLPGRYALRFRYFAAPRADLRAQVFSTVSKDNFSAGVQDLRPGVWRVAEIPFAALRRTSGAGLSAADRVHTIGFVQAAGGGSFFVDDVEIIDLDPP